MKLKALHSLFQDSILTFEPLINIHLCQPPRGSLEDRIAIYTQGYYTRLENCLMTEFPLLRQVMGEKSFFCLLENYIETYPSYSYTINLYGQHLSHFLKVRAKYSQKPQLSEIAGFEWTQSQAQVKADAEILTPADLQNLTPDDWPELVFKLHPSCQIIEFKWNSFEIIEAIRHKKSKPKAKILKKSLHLVLWRCQQEIAYQVLDEPEYLILNAIESATPFIGLCEKLALWMAEEAIAPYLVHKLQLWLNKQLFIKNQ